MYKRHENDDFKDLVEKYGELEKENQFDKNKDTTKYEKKRREMEVVSHQILFLQDK